MTGIGGSAFDGCTGLTGVYITDLAKWCGISFGSIGANPLYYAYNLYVNGALVTDLTIPDSVTGIGRYAFYYCTGLTSITFTGTKAQWNAISKGSGWNSGTGAYIIHCTDGDIAKS